MAAPARKDPEANIIVWDKLEKEREGELAIEVPVPPTAKEEEEELELEFGLVPRCASMCASLGV